MNLARHAARAAMAAETAQRAERLKAEHDEKMSQLRRRAQIGSSEAYDAIKTYLMNQRSILQSQCEHLDPERQKTSLARAQGGIEQIDGTIAFFEQAKREEAEVEQTTGQ